MALKKVGALWDGKEGSKAVFSGTLEMEGKEGPKIKVYVFPSKSANPKAPKYEIFRGDDDPTPF